jgi:hypothetical protein
MPTAFPPTVPTLSGDVLTINRFLANPTAVYREVRTLADQQFIADKLLLGRIPVQGGAVQYEVSESIYSDRDPSAVGPGGEYEGALTPQSVAALATVKKYGQDIPLTDEALARQPGTAVNKVLRKSVNKTVAFVDAMALAAVATAVTQTQAAAAAWSNASADPFLDVMLADAVVSDLAEGYMPDALFLTNTLYARLVANQKVIAGLRRESSNTVTETGEVLQIANKTLFPVPASRMPSGVTVMLVDRQQLGSLAYENLPSPEYTGSADGIQSFVRRNPKENDSWLIRTRRLVVPIVQEPASSVKITGA